MMNLKRLNMSNTRDARAPGAEHAGMDLIVVLGGLLTACGGNTIEIVTESASTTGTTLGDTTLGGTPDDPGTTVLPGTSVGADDTGTGTTTTATTTGMSTGSSSGMPGEVCETILCAGACCEAGEECIGEQCVAACETEIRCGVDDEICCEEGDVCLEDVCVAALGPCLDTYDCAPGELCEPVLDQCIPLLEPLDCQRPPGFDAADVVVQWSWESDEVSSVPVVGDVDGDQRPEIIINTVNATDPSGASAIFFGQIVVLDGIFGTEQFRVEQDLIAGTYGSYSRSSIGLGDVDGDGVADIIYSGRPEINIPPFDNNSSLVHAIDGQGNLLWSSHAPDGSPHYIYVRYGAPLVVNLDDDDASEIVFGTAVIDDDGTVVFDQDNELLLGGGAFGSNGTFRGGISTAADLTGDGYPEIISGRQAWTVTWDQPMAGPPSVQLSPLWEYPGPDGFTAVADLDDDGTPEVILVGDPFPYTDPDGDGPGLSDGQLQVLDGQTGQLWCGIDPSDALCLANDALRTQPIALRGSAPGLGGGRGGPPVVADFDGDGRPEIGVAGGARYAVYDLNRMGEGVVQPAGDPAPDPGALYVRWASTIFDELSSSTGAAAYDFDGDGISEIVFGDECTLRIYGGPDGAVLFEADSPSPTFHEYSTVADVDDDANAELLVVASDDDWANRCTEPGYVPRQGVFAYRDAHDRWMRTRQVWSSHSYHVTNATSAGLYPPMEINNWDDAALNDYRQNFRAPGVFNAPNLVVELAVDVAGCAQEGLEIIATVRNTGAIGVPIGAEVTLYRGTDATGEPVSTQATSVGLPPGSQTSFTWLEPNPGNMPQDYYVVVDEGAAVSECVEDDNEASAVGVACPGG